MGTLYNIARNGCYLTRPSCWGLGGILVAGQGMATEAVHCVGLLSPGLEAQL